MGLDLKNIKKGDSVVRTKASHLGMEKGNIATVQEVFLPTKDSRGGVTLVEHPKYKHHTGKGTHDPRNLDLYLPHKPLQATINSVVAELKGNQ